jgi:hypothetical protein
VRLDMTGLSVPYLTEEHTLKTEIGGQPVR